MLPPFRTFGSDSDKNNNNNRVNRRKRHSLSIFGSRKKRPQFFFLLQKSEQIFGSTLKSRKKIWRLSCLIETVAGCLLLVILPAGADYVRTYVRTRLQKTAHARLRIVSCTIIKSCINPSRDSYNYN